LNVDFLRVTVKTFIKKNFHFDPAEIDALILSQTHINHSGNISNLVRNGFDGCIYATAATVDLCQIILHDFAYLRKRY